MAQPSTQQRRFALAQGVTTARPFASSVHSIPKRQMRPGEFRAAALTIHTKQSKALAKIRASLIVLLVYRADGCISSRRAGIFWPTYWAGGLPEELVQLEGLRYDIESNLASTKGKCAYIIHSSINHLAKDFPLTLICYLSF